MKKILLGNEAIVQAALEAGVDFATGYPGCPSAEIGDIFGKIAKENGIYYEQSVNEKVALETAIGASFSGLKTLVDMKSFGLNVCSDSLFPLAYTGTKGPMVIVVGDDPNCWSSAQSEQNSRGYAYLSNIPVLEPADPKECYEFTKLAFKISEKFNLPVILRTTIRVAHARMPVEFEKPALSHAKGNFVKNLRQFITMPPRVLEMKAELLEKIKKIKLFVEKNKINQVSGKKGKIGLITSGVAHLYAMDVLNELGLDLPVLKINMFFPLAEKDIEGFIKKLGKVLVVEELEGYLEKEIKAIAKSVNPKLKIFGKDVLPEIGELNAQKVGVAIASLTGKKIKTAGLKAPVVARRHSKFCEGCPHVLSLSAIKRAAPEGTIYGGDIGCYMMAGFEPFFMQDYLFDMGADAGISHGIVKSTGQKVISFMGDSTFFHSGLSGIINAVYNKSNPLFVILDNMTTAMTGNEPNPGMGKTGMNEDSDELKIDQIVLACGVKHVKVLDPINFKELEATVKEFLEKDEVSVIICKRICALLAKRQSNE